MDQHEDPGATLAAAWRLAYVVTGDEDTARYAVRAALATELAWLGPPSHLEMLSSVYREAEAVLAEAGDACAPGNEPAEDRTGSVVDRLWRLPADERVALWMQAEGVASDDSSLILSLPPTAFAARCAAGTRRVAGPADIDTLVSRLPVQMPADLADLADIDRAARDLQTGSQPVVPPETDESRSPGRAEKRKKPKNNALGERRTDPPTDIPATEIAATEIAAAPDPPPEPGDQGRPRARYEPAHRRQSGRRRPTKAAVAKTAAAKTSAPKTSAPQVQPRARSATRGRQQLLGGVIAALLMAGVLGAVAMHSPVTSSPGQARTVGFSETRSPAAGTRPASLPAPSCVGNGCG